MKFTGLFSKKAKNLIKSLLTIDPTKRLGCLKNGSEDVKSHEFFSVMDWSDLYNKRIEAPYIPEINSPNDTSYFHEFLECADDAVEIAKYDETFKDW